MLPDFSMVLWVPRCPPDVTPCISARTSFTLQWGMTIFFFPSADSQWRSVRCLSLRWISTGLNNSCRLGPGQWYPSTRGVVHYPSPTIVAQGRCLPTAPSSVQRQQLLSAPIGRGSTPWGMGAWKGRLRWCIWCLDIVRMCSCTPADAEPIELSLPPDF